MPNDFVQTLQSGLTAAALFLFAIFALLCIAVAAAPVIRTQWRRWCKKDAITKIVAVVGVGIAIVYGGSKPHYVPNAGSDNGLGVTHIAAEYDETNDVTNVEVGFVGQNVTTATPVSVRNSQTESWRELEKIGADVTVDLPTNLLTFAVSGNVATNRFWWAGTETPAVIIESAGIEIVEFRATSSFVQILWTCDDPNATSFSIQRRRKGTTTWETVGVTTSFAFVYVGFTVGETWEWRVTATYTEGE